MFWMRNKENSFPIHTLIWRLKSLPRDIDDGSAQAQLDSFACMFKYMGEWVKVFRIIPEFRILRLTFHRKSA